MLETGELAIKLRKVASDINSATDQFMESMDVIEQGLKGMNLGITAQVSVNDRLALGYGKVSSVWGLFIIEYHEDSSSTTWSFKEAPREYRLVIVDKLPDLFVVLTAQAEDMIKQLSLSLDFIHKVTQ